MKSAMWQVTILLLFLLLSPAVACAEGEEASGKIKVFVSILPQKYFVERIGGDRVDVNVLVGPGQSPHMYDPTPRRLAELSEARVFFRIGVPFEEILMPKIESAFKGLAVVDTSKGIQLREMESHGEEHEAEDAHDRTSKGEGYSGEDAHTGTDRHDAEDGHSHEAGSPDPHIWLDPMRVKIQARTICDSLSMIDPAGAASYRRNLKRFEEDLDRVDALIAKALAPVKGKPIFVFHPAYGYFAERYGLVQTAVETGGKEPGARQLGRLIEKAKRADVKVIFVQPQFDMKYASTIAEAIGGAVVSLDPLAPDYINNLEDMAEKVGSALSRSSEK
ncbi:MAG: zinc ABC transporter substrate-binding protein [Desulfomonilaceae bacterium]|nr:zinc ABC transporter substrate-binding protein [Desulfomonilaceae bacterium]